MQAKALVEEERELFQLCTHLTAKERQWHKSINALHGLHMSDVMQLLEELATKCMRCAGQGEGAGRGGEGAVAAAHAPGCQGAPVA